LANGLFFAFAAASAKFTGGIAPFLPDFSDRNKAEC
jgi:hypothetical protein